MRAAEYEQSIADGQLAAWTEDIEIVMQFVRTEGGWTLAGYNERGEQLFERNAWAVGLPAVKAEASALMADNGYLPLDAWTPDVKPQNAFNYSRGPLRRRFRS